MKTERNDPRSGRLPSPREQRASSISPLARRLLIVAGLAAGLLAPALGAGQESEEKVPPKSPVPPADGGGVPQRAFSERGVGIIFGARVAIGDPGPDFTLTATDGSTFRLRTIKNQGAAALVFLQRADPYLAGYAPTTDTLKEQGIHLVFLSQQRPPREPRGWPGITLVHDERGDVARLYGVRELLSGDTVPAVYLLDAQQKVRYFAIGRLPSPGELQAVAVGVLGPQSSE